MFKKILVGLDILVESEHAFDDALAIAKANGSDLTIAHVFSLDESYSKCQALLYSLGEARQSEKYGIENFGLPIEQDPVLQCVVSRSVGNKNIDQVKFLEMCRDEAEKAGIKTDILPRLGRPGHLLCEVARDEEFDLIVVGHRDKSWHTKIIDGKLRLGSVSHYVVHQSPCSILIAHRHLVNEKCIGSLKEMRRILAAVDNSGMGRVVFKEALDLARETGANLFVTYVQTSIEPNESLSLGQIFKDMARASSVPLEFIQDKVADSKSVGPRICELAEQQKVDLILIGRRNLSTVQEAIMGSTSHHVAYHASCGVLVVQNRDYHHTATIR